MCWASGGGASQVTYATAPSAACFQCLNASSILSSHGMAQNVGVTFNDFSLLCPALLHQIDDGACIVHGAAAAHGDKGTLSERVAAAAILAQGWGLFGGKS